MMCTNCTELEVSESSSNHKARMTKSRTMFKLQPLEGGKFKLEKERGSSLIRNKKTSPKHSTDKLNFKNGRTCFRMVVWINPLDVKYINMTYMIRYENSLALIVSYILTN